MKTKKKCLKKVFAFFAVLVVLAAFAVPSFAGSIQSEAYQVVVDTGVLLTGYGQTNVGNVRPIAQMAFGFDFSVDRNKFYVQAYPTDGGFPTKATTLPAECTFSTDVQNSLDVIPNYLYPDADFRISSSLVYPYGYWRTYNGSDGNVYDAYDPNSLAMFDLTGGNPDNAKFGLRAWTSASADVAAKCTHLVSYTITYTPAIWSSGQSINLGDKGSLNSENAIYNALRVGGYTTLTLNFKSAYADEGDLDTCTKFVQWIGYQGDFAFSNTSYTGSAGGGSATDTDASYQLGYEAGKAAGEQNTASKVAEAYQNGYDAGSVNSGLIPSALLAIGEIPFNLIRSFLDFEIFGFNLSALVAISVTGVAFLWILKLFV